LLVAAAVGELSGVACLGVESDQVVSSVALSLGMVGRGGARGRGRGGTGEPGAVATAADATTIPTDATSSGVWTDATVWISISLWLHARTNAYMGV
jgi:hypothetical protein